MELLLIILPLVGVLLGWGLTQISNYFNIYLSDKRILKETLYFLLELHKQISDVKLIEEVAETSIKILNDSIPNFTSNQTEYEQVVQIMKKNASDFHNPRIETELKELNENYDKCLLKLASVDPIIAYRLKGKNKIISYLSQWNNFATEAIISNPLVNSDPKTLQFSDTLKPQVETDLINESLKDLKEIILEIIKSIGGKTKNNFNKSSIFSSTESKKEIEVRLEKYIKDAIIPNF